MTVLTPYDVSRRQSTIAMVAAFFADHFAVSENEPAEITSERLAAAEEDLDERSRIPYEKSIDVIGL